MKQTNNAIKFLMAQYRAIFKHAYLKGIVSAVVLTTGLAAGAANADPLGVSGSSAWDELKGTGTYTNIDNATDLNIEKSGASTTPWNATLILDGSQASGSLTITNASSGSGTATINGSGTLQITGASGASGTFTLTTSGSGNAIELNIKNVDVQAYGTLNITANEAAATVGGQYDGTNWTTVSLAENGVINLSGSGAVATLGGQLNAKGGTIVNQTAENVITTFGTNQYLNITAQASADSGTNSLIFKLEDDEDTTVDESLLQITSGNIVVVQGATGSGSGLLDIQKGTLEITDKAILVAAADADDAKTVPGIQVSGSGTEAVLKIDQSILTNFITGEAEIVDTTTFQSGTTAGGILVSGSGTLFINPDEENGVVDLYTLTKDGSVKILSGSDVAAGTINVSGGTIEASKLAISDKAETTNLDLGQAALKAETLILGNNNLSQDDSQGITFSGATVSEVLETHAKGGTFDLSSNVTLDRDYFQKNADDETNKATANGSPVLVSTTGKITGADINLSGSAELTVASGKWVADSGLDITVNNGTTLSVTAQSGSQSTSQYLNDADTAYLALNGKLTLNSGSVEVTGDSGADAVLDLTSADVVFTSGSITVSGAAIELGDTTTGFKDYEAASKYFAGALEDKVGLGKLILNNSDLSEYLDPKNTATTIEIGDDGVLEIANAGRRTLDISKLTNTATSGSIAFTGAGYMLYDNALLLQDSVDQEASLNIGEGTIIARQIDISAAKDVEGGKDHPINDTSIVGNLVVSQGFSTNSSKLTLGDSSSNSGASLTLAAESSTAGGFIDVGTDGTMILNAGTADATFNVESGVWENSNLNIEVVSGGTATGVFVGSEDNADPAAQFTANNFKSTLGANNALTVNQTGNAQFTSMQLATGDNVAVYGQLTLTGRDIDSGDESVDPLKNANTVNGIDLKDATLTIDGSTAVLEFGANASNALVDFDGNEQAAEGESKLLVVSGGISNAEFTLSNLGTLKFNFDKSVTLSDKDLEALTTQLTINGTLGVNGFLNIGDADIGVTVTEENGNYYAEWNDNVDKFVGVHAGGVTSNKLEQALITGIDTTDRVQGKFGALQSESQYNIQTNGALSLGNAAPFGGYFAYYTDAQGNKQAAGLSLGGDLNLQNGGTVGEIDAGGFDVILSSSVENPALTKIMGSVSDAGEFDVQTATEVHGDIDAESLLISSTLDNSQEINNKTSSDYVEITSNGVFKTLDWAIGSAGTYHDSVIMGSADAQNVTVTNSSLNVLNGTLKANSIALDNNSELLIGYEPSANDTVDDPDTIFDETKSYTGYLEVGNLSLSGGLLAVDPIYNQDTAFASVGSLYGYNSLSTNDKQAWSGTLDGSAFVGQNSVLGIGTDSLAELKEIASPYMYGNTLKQSDTGAIIYLDKKIKVGNGYGITLTALGYDEFISDFNARNVNTALSTDFGSGDAPIKANTLFLGANTALVLSENAVNNSKVTSTDGATDGIIQFAANDAYVVADGGRIDISGNVRANAAYQIFNDGDNAISIIQMDGNAYSVDSDYAIKIATENGFLVGAVDEKGQAELGVAKDARSKMSGASDPVFTTLVAYANGYNGDTKTTDSELYNGYTEADPAVKNYNYDNPVLQESITTGNGAAAEQVARLGVYGGSVQAALTAGATTYDAVSARMGVGAQTGSITFADNGQGAGLWVTPIYKNHDSDGFEAQGLSYGADMDMYGVALGGDYTLGNGLRVGAAFNVGSGDADGQGAGAGVSNDFDYYGFTVYGGYTMDKLSVVADVSYTVVDNDVEGNNSYGKVSTSMDTTNLSFGVTGQYTFNLNAVDVVPHAGLRYTYIDMDDYNVKGVDGYEVARYAGDSMSVFSIPVGVTFSKEIVSGDWTVKPAFDLTLTANVGDDSIDGSVAWNGVDNLTTNLESEVIDSFTYGATLGVSAKTGNFSMGFGVNYTGASSADEYGVSANARFVF